jgi:hypothetical protein
MRVIIEARPDQAVTAAGIAQEHVAKWGDNHAIPANKPFTYSVGAVWFDITSGKGWVKVTQWTVG